MTGPEHYREAEQQLEYADRADSREWALIYVSHAQVHATLALAAATATTPYQENEPEPGDYGTPE